MTTLMDLKRRNPGLYERLLEACGGNMFAASAAWIGLCNEGEAEGAEQERQRCLAHLAVYKRSGNIEVAYAAVVSGATVEEIARWYGDQVASALKQEEAV